MSGLRNEGDAFVLMQAAGSSPWDASRSTTSCETAAPPLWRAETPCPGTFLGLPLCAASARPHADDVLEPFDRSNNAGRLAAYMMSVTVMLFVLPIGLFMFALNALFGENLRTTAHLTALTGLCMSLSLTEHGASLLGLG